MRPWLENLLNTKSVEGFKWRDEESKIFEIPWRHGSRHGWNSKKDADLFERWAKHTGRYDVDQPNPKKWKANFRCALNSLPDVEEITSTYSKGNGQKCVRIFKFLKEEKHKKTYEGRRPYKRRKLSSESDKSSYSTDSVASPSTTSDSDKVTSSHQTIDTTLPDSTSTTWEHDNLPQDDVYRLQERVKTETLEHIEVIELPCNVNIPDLNDFEIERGVLPNHMSGFVLILNPRVDGLTESSTRESDDNSPNSNLPFTSEIVPSSQRKRSHDSSDDDTSCSGSPPSSPEYSEL